MLELVDVGPPSLSAYRGVAPDAVLDDLVRHAEDLRGARVLHVNATPYGGGVSELLRSGAPILNDLGLIAHWKIIRGDDRFFQVTKKVHVRRRRHVDRIRRSHGLDVALVDCRARPAGAPRLASCSGSRIAVATTRRGLTGNDPQATDTSAG